MSDWLKKFFVWRDKYPEKSERGMRTITCKMCGRTFTLPENVQHWPDICQ